MERIIVKVGKRYSFLNTDDISWVESDNGYLRIHIKDKYHVILMTLKEFQKKLNSENFIRISRSYIINILMIKEMIDSDKSNDYKVVLNDNTILKWSRRFRTNFPDLLLLK